MTPEDHWGQGWLKPPGRIGPRPETEPITLAEARRWAEAGAVLSPGIVFSALLGDMIYSYHVISKEHPMP